MERFLTHKRFESTNAMLYSYLKTALRNLVRHRFFSAINILGLAVAMTICMMLIMLVADQLSYDRYNTNADRIYRVKTIDVYEGKVLWDNQWNSASCMPLGPELVSNYTGIEQAVRIVRGFGNGWMKFENQDVNLPLAGFFADPEVFDFFQIELLYGDPATALVDPYTVVLTKKTAERLFKEENPMGKTFKVGDLGIYTVTGVLKETRNKSHIVFDGLASMASVRSLEASGKRSHLLDIWSMYWQGWTYIKAEEGKSEEDIQEQLDLVYEKHIASITKPGVYKMKFGLQPLLNITPGEIMNNGIGPQMPWEFVYFLGGLAGVILVTSCFNFTNLSIARSLTRAREIGVRKVSGAARRQIFAQFMTEAVVVSFAALLIATVLVGLLKPVVLQLSFAQVFHWDMYTGSTLAPVSIAFTLVVGMLAGFFPAVVLSRFQPVDVLKNLSNLRLFSRMGLRKALLVSQFVVSLFFILTVIVIYNQMNLFTHQDHGFNIKQNILIPFNKTNPDRLKTALQKYNNITAVAAASHVPAAGTSHGGGINRPKEGVEPIDCGIFEVDENYAENMNLEIIAGTFFTPEQGASKRNMVVINEAAATKMDYQRPQDAVGEPMLYMNDSTTKTIIGVVRNYNHRDLTRAITPMILLYDTAAFKVLQVSYSGTYAEATKTIEKAWNEVNPGLQVDYIAVEAEINKYYELVFGALVTIVATVSFLAIFISCLGLLGMATYATETRIREISIRKVLGSTPAAIVMLLSRGFANLLVLAIAIGLPLAWLFNSFWLEQIAYRTTIGIGTIAITIVLVLVFGIFTIGSQTLRAAGVNPAEHLKSD